MNTFPRKLAESAVLLGLAGFASTAAMANCTLPAAGGDGPGSSLQDAFNNILGAGAPVVGGPSCVTEGTDSTWQFSGTNGSASVLFEFAGYANSNTFGLYDPANPSTRIQVFNGAASTGATRTLIATPNGSGWQFGVLGGGPPFTAPVQFSSNIFGFYLDTPQGGAPIYFSNTALNTTDNFDHMQAYQGSGNTFTAGPLNGFVFGFNDYILAWEDLLGGGDKDYQDFVVLVRDVMPSAVPLPPAAWLLLSGIAGLAVIGRRRRRYDAVAA